MFQRIVLIIVTIWFLVGCGPSDDGGVPAGTNSLTIDSESQANDSKSLQVGFTEEGRPYRGDPNAPIVMEEYSDFQCPFCARFYSETMGSIEENQIANGEVVIVFYDFPLTRIHPQAMSAHVAGRCAAEQGASAFWEMHDALFNKVNEWSGQNNAAIYFSRYAREIGLDGAAFDQCQANNQYQSEIEATINLGIANQVNSTPTFFLNGQRVIGAQPLAVFNDAFATIQTGGQLANQDPGQSADNEPAGLKPTPASLSEDVAFAFGDPAAPIQVIEFTDYQCPYCYRHVTETMPRILSDYVATGQVYYVLKDFPLESIHPDARRAAMAARCAGEQELYEQMHTALFTNQEQWSDKGSERDTVFTNIATSLGADGDEFYSCLSSERYDGAVQTNLNEGLNLGLRGTPSFYINGFPVQGAQPFELFQYAFDLALKGTLADAYEQQPTPTPAAPAGPLNVPLDDEPTIGDPNAPIVIIEYTDFQCPYCSRHFAETFPVLLQNFVNTGQVRYVFKDFPLTSIHPQAMGAAEAARCAHAQGAYLRMHDALFANQAQWSGQPDPNPYFLSYAESLGLDNEQFKSCLDNHTYQAAVEAELQEGIQLGIRGTPAFFINGYPLSGAQPYPVFEQAISDLTAQLQEN